MPRKKTVTPKANAVEVPEVEAAESRTEEIKTEEKAAEPEKTPVKRTARTAAAKTTTVQKETAKKETVKKGTAKKAELKTTLCVQYAGKEVEEEDLIKCAKDAWKKEKRKVGELKSMELYIKPEENKVYYVMNGDVKGDFDICWRL